MRIFEALRRLWRFATCDHWNSCRTFQFDETTSLTACKKCGRVLHYTMSEADAKKPLVDHLDRGTVFLESK